MPPAGAFAVPEMTTARLALRVPSKFDRIAIAAICGEAEVAHRLSYVPHPYTLADADFFLEHVVPAQWVWAISLQDEDALIGVIGLSPIASEQNDRILSADIGYWLAPTHWGRGIVSEAVAAVLGYGFTALKLQRMIAGPFVDNAASIRLLEKLGFTANGAGTRPCLAAGNPMPSVEMVLMAKTWRGTTAV